MRIVFLLVIALAGTARAAQPVSEADATAALALAKDSGCLSCHSLKEKIVGPAYMKVADKYKDDSDAEDTLVHSIKYGSTGKWGRFAMPAHPDLSDERMHFLARWVLSVGR